MTPPCSVGQSAPRFSDTRSCVNARSRHSAATGFCRRCGTPSHPDCAPAPGQPRRRYAPRPRQFFGFLLAPGDNAGRTQTQGAEQVLHDIADTILGNQLLRVQMDRRRLDARPVLNMRGHLRRERRLRHAAETGAGMDVGVMLGHLQPRLRQIEHLPLRHQSPSKLSAPPGDARNASLRSVRSCPAWRPSAACRPDARAARHSSS